MKYDFTLLTPLSFQKEDSHICLYAKYDLFQVFVSEASPHLPPVSQSVTKSCENLVRTSPKRLYGLS